MSKRKKQTEQDVELAAEFPDCEPNKRGFRKRVAHHLAWQHAEALIDDLAERGLLEDHFAAAIDTVKGTLLRSVGWPRKREAKS